MAGTTYPVQVLNENGGIFLEGFITFPDPSDQPAGQPPFEPAAGDDLTLLATSSDQPLIVGGDDTAGVTIKDSAGNIGLQAASGNVTVGDSGTENAILHGSAVAIEANALGFYATSPISKQTVSDATAAAIIAALAALGLITDGT